MSVVRIHDFIIGEEHPAVLIAGPCVIEERGARDTWGPTWETAKGLKEISEHLGMSLVFKASFDKANRSHVDSFRGPGIADGVRILDAIKREYDIPIITDIHAVDQIEMVKQVADMIQIPAFLCRQTDLLLAAGRTGRIVNVKKGQFLAPNEIRGIASKLDSVDAEYVFTERGMTFGPNSLIVDMRSIEIMKAFAPVIFDATHSVQLPGAGSTSGGEKQFVFPLARAATAVGVHGLFFEVHPMPSVAKCDGPNMLALGECEHVFGYLKALDEFTKNHLK